ncbi:MAG: DMT family transporter [Christensenellales bacterium]|jgi:drug/metabolite transporter (DMT)-like permease
MKDHAKRGSLLLLAASVIWGSTFVAQSLAAEHIRPFTFQCVRSILGALALLPAILLVERVNKKKRAQHAPPGSRRLLLQGGIACGVVLFVATNLQQFGLEESGAGKAGFITALYILFVPILGLFRGHRVRPVLWVSICIAGVGLYLLSVKEGFRIATGDLLLFLCAIAFAVQILLVDYYGLKVSGLKLCSLQFLVSGLLSGVLMITLEKPDPARIPAAWGPLLYAGVLSSGVAYTLQIFGQRTTPPAIASLLMSLESVFAVLTAILVLGQMPTAREWAGCALMFGAILLAQRGQFQNSAM